MSAIYVLIAVSLLVALGFLAAFLWSVKDGQYDDDLSPSVRILMEDGSTDTQQSTTES
jgi:cbb3-type cytochrome oxidase maturation protein